MRSAWSVLRGQSVVPAQILSEWVEYQQIFNDLLQRFSASLARQAKAERRRVQELARSVEPAPEHRPVRPERKSELRARAAQARGLAPSNGANRLHSVLTPRQPELELEEESP